MRAILSASVLLLLVGCTTSALQPTSPYTLSTSEFQTVVRSIHWSLKDHDSVEVEKVKAAKNADGHVYVCGWMHSKQDGSYAGERLFFGTLFAGQFEAKGFAKDPLDVSKIEAMCHEYGVVI